MIIGGKSTCALQTYPLVDHQSTTLTLSQSELNRISVANDRIQQVFGAEGTFDVQSDEEGGQIFLKLGSPSYLGSPSPKISTITIITESGLTQDLRLVPKEVEFQSILLKPQVGQEEEKETKKNDKSQLQEIIGLMKAMVRNETIEGYVKSSLDQSTISSVAHEQLKNLSLTPLFHYKGEQYEGRVYSLTNQGSTSLHLKEDNFATYGDQAIALHRRTLHASETTTLYVISRRTS